MAALPKIRLTAEIPDDLKAEVAKTKWGNVLSITPVVMTVIATMLAGLASSEMTSAQYDRSLAAQRQSKAGDQWNFFQGKKLRGVVLRSTLDTMGATTGIHPLDPAALRQALAGTPAAAELETAAGRPALAALTNGTLPKLPPAPPAAASVQAALTALEESRSDAEMARLLVNVDGGPLDDALRQAQAHALALEEALRRDFTAARLNYNATRYDSEARLNQAIAGLFELQVRKSNISAERHHRRSSRFFYGMLAAQLGVIVSTLAMAAHQRSLRWAIAAGAGAVAIAFAVYVLVYV